MRTRTMLTVLASMALTVAAAAPMAAQGTDFGGTWQLDRDASEFQEFGGGRGGGPGRGGPGRGMMGAATLVISQADDLLIEQQSEQGSRTLTYRPREHEWRPAWQPDDDIHVGRCRPRDRRQPAAVDATRRLLL